MRERARYVGIALLAVVAVAGAASTLDTARTGGSGASGFGGGTDSGFGSTVNVSELEYPATQIPYLGELLAAFVVLGTVATIVYLVLDFQAAVKTVATVVAVFGLLVLGLWVLLEFVGLGGQPGFGRNGLGNISLAAEGGGTGTGDVSPISGGLLVVFAAVFGIIALFQLARQTDEEAESTGVETDADAAAIGRAAGRAADRIERNADVDNEVYRSWAEMTALLDMPDPETSTAGEFADAAVEAGLGRTDVDELTRLFEDVRYGDAPATAEREQTAVAVFRRIEDRYAEEPA